MKIIAAVGIALGSLGCGVSAAGPHVGAPVSMDGERPLTVRAEAGRIWASYHIWSEPSRAWLLPAHGSVEDLQVRARPNDSGFVVTFRQGGVAWRGELDADRTARGPLQALPPEPAQRHDGSLVAAR